MNEEASPPAVAWRDGSHLVLWREHPVAPDRCIVTNEPILGTRKYSRRLTWGANGPGGAPLPAKLQIFWSLATMQAVTVHVGLAERLKTRRLILLVLSAAAIVGGLMLFVHGLSHGFPPLMGYLASGAVLVIFALTILANTWAVVDIVAVDKEYVWLRGAKKPFLDSLPEFRRQ